MSKKSLLKYLAGVVGVLMLAVVGLYFTSTSETEFTVDTPPPGLELDAGYNATLSGVPFYTVTQGDEDMYDDTLPTCSSTGDGDDRGNGWYSVVAYENGMSVKDIVFGQAEFEKGDSLLAVYYNPEAKTFEALPNKIIKGTGGVDLPLLSLNKTLEKGEVVVLNSSRSVEFCNDYSVAAGHDVVTSGSWNLVSKPDFDDVAYRSIWEVDFGKMAGTGSDALNQYYKEGDTNFETDDLADGDLYWIYGGSQDGDDEQATIVVDESIAERIRDAFRPESNVEVDDSALNNNQIEVESSNPFSRLGDLLNDRDDEGDGPVVVDPNLMPNNPGSYNVGDLFNRPDLTVGGGGSGEQVIPVMEFGERFVLEGRGVSVSGEVIKGSVEKDKGVTIQCGGPSAYVTVQEVYKDGAVAKSLAVGESGAVLISGSDADKLDECVDSGDVSGEIEVGYSFKKAMYDDVRNHYWIIADDNTINFLEADTGYRSTMQEKVRSVDDVELFVNQSEAILTYVTEDNKMAYYVGFNSGYDDVIKQTRPRYVDENLVRVGDVDFVKENKSVHVLHGTRDLTGGCDSYVECTGILDQLNINYEGLSGGCDSYTECSNLLDQLNVTNDDSVDFCDPYTECTSYKYTTFKADSLASLDFIYVDTELVTYDQVEAGVNDVYFRGSRAGSSKLDNLGKYDNGQKRVRMLRFRTQNGDPTDLFAKDFGVSTNGTKDFLYFSGRQGDDTGKVKMVDKVYEDGDFYAVDYQHQNWILNEDGENVMSYDYEVGNYGTFGYIVYGGTMKVIDCYPPANPSEECRTVLTVNNWKPGEYIYSNLTAIPLPTSIQFEELIKADNGKAYIIGSDLIGRVVVLNEDLSNDLVDGLEEVMVSDLVYADDDRLIVVTEEGARDKIRVVSLD